MVSHFSSCFFCLFDRLFERSIRTIWLASAIFFLTRCEAIATPQESSLSSESIRSATRSIDESLQRISERSSDRPNVQADRTLSETIASFRLLLDFKPADRRRYVLPRTLESGKIGADKLRRLLEANDEWEAIQSSLDRLIEGVEQAANSMELTKDFEGAYELRWKLAGLQSILPSNPTSKRSRKTASWLHSDSLKVMPELRKAFANHPKTRWPAGSYSIATTPHFEIAFQCESKAATEVALLCEQSFAIWKQVFFSYWQTEQTIAPEYREADIQKYSVVLFRDRDAYVRALRAIPDISVSTGYYDPNQKLALFYWDGNKTPSTVVHELTHQFFYETGAKRVLLDTDRGHGFWVVEGAALYLESLSTRAVGGGLVVDVGGWDSPRLQAGRYRRLHDMYWVPWDEFHVADGTRIRSEEDIRAWYSQAAGLAHLWLDGNSQKRQEFQRYLNSVYVNGENAMLLDDWNDDRKLRDAYDGFLINGPSALAVRPFFPNRREAVLSRSKLTSQQMLEWPVELRTTPWLDLSYSQADDSLFVVNGKEVSPIWNVQRLNLESTKVSDASMRAIAGSKSLTELDLSQCHITDIGLSELRGHKSLKTLWLNQCPITDKSIEVLLTIAQLESVHVLKTEISSQGWERLVASKPRLKLKSTAP